MSLSINLMNYCTHYTEVAKTERVGVRVQDQVPDGDVADLLRKDSDVVLNISVCFDGSCQERGSTFHYSIYSMCTDILRGLL